MKLLKICTFIIFFIFLSASLLFSASGDTAPAAHLIYFDDPYEIEIYDAGGNRFDYVDWNMALPEGTSISTLNTTAEIELVPNGTIIKLAPFTDFIIETLQENKQTANTFKMLGGKMRAVAARSGIGENYSIQTPSAVCGVRGTDFGLQVISGKMDAVAVLQGQVEFVNVLTGESIDVAAGQSADVFADVFAPVQLDADTLTTLFEPMSFSAADPESVPGYSNEQAAAAEMTTEEELEAEAERIAREMEEQFEEPEPSPEEPVESTDTSEPVPEEPDEGEPPGADVDILEPAYSFLGRFFGLELGTISINGKTYKKIAFIPKLEIRKFRMALYLPIIFNTNMFDPSDYYMPEGNDEWSFGRDKSGTWPVFSDVLQDLSLKIKYIEYGDNQDPFFFKIGNSESVTLGHGILMRNFPFDIGFPVERHLGINAGIGFNAIGFEALVADAGVPDILGGRLYFRPFHKVFPLGIAVSSIVDLHPANQLVNSSAKNGDPIFITAALDLDYPLFRTDPFSLTLFSDAGFVMPYFREAYGESISPGIAPNAVLTDPRSLSFQSLNNYGFIGGILGNALFIDYRVEYRLSKGVFTPPFLSATYHRRRGAFVDDFVSFFTDPSAERYQQYTMGIYGELGATAGKLFSIEAGYFWPWELYRGSVQPSENDLFHLQFTLNPGVIPVVGIYGSLSYDRSKFAQTFTDPQLSLFDAYTTVKGEIVVPIVPVVHVALIYTTTTAYDNNGQVIPSSVNPELPEINASFSIETRINF